MRKWTALAAAVALAACQGPSGDTGDTGAPGAPGTPGTPGTPGEPGAGYLPLEPNGVVGFVKDTAGEPVVGAKVFLVPNGDIPTAAIDLTSITAARASDVDEPLEDTIAKNGTGYAQATTDANGIYRIANVPAGRYYVTVVPATGDDAHLPGGSLCRSSLAESVLVNKQVDIKVSTKPSAKAEYVGPSVCLGCHGVVHEQQTLHMLGIREIASAGKLQKSDRFPDWYTTTLAKFGADTTLVFYDFNGTNNWKVAEEADVPAGAVVSFKARLYLVNSGDLKPEYYVDLIDVKGSSGTQTHQVELSYGGGIFKQRFITKIGSSRWILPIQFNTEGLAVSATADSSRWVWQHYNAQNWYVEDTTTPASSHFKTTLAPEKSFDNACAGCHFTGYRFDATTNTASGVPDEAGEYDYDGDGVLESMNISCETCHGPGSEHWYRAGNGRAIVSPSLLTPEREVNICAQCHTRAIGNGGLKNAAGTAFTTEAPLNGNARMMPAGTSRAEFLASYVSKIDDGLWATGSGDGVHSQKHHQQASDFVKSKKYRNPYELLTCASCHDLHGNSGLKHQLQTTLDSTSAGAGLCLSCHDAYFPAGATVAERMQKHWVAEGINWNGSKGEISCVDCHMPKTAKSGSGEAQKLISGVQYWSGDISSHIFDVPRRADITTKSGSMMPIPYTNACGGCHAAAP